MSNERVPSERADSGWIPWAGGKCPVEPSAKVWTRYRDGSEHAPSIRAGSLIWQHDGMFDDIIAYRLSRQEDQQETAMPYLCTPTQAAIDAEKAEARQTPRTDVERLIGNLIAWASGEREGTVKDLFAKAATELAALQARLDQCQYELREDRKAIILEARKRLMAGHERDGMLEKLIAAERALAEARAKERERCKEVCVSLRSSETDWDTSYWNQAVELCAHRIESLTDEAKP